MRLRYLILCVVAWALTAALPASASFPGANGKIAYVASDGSDLEIYSIGLDGANKKQLTDNSVNDLTPGCSRNEKKFFFKSHRAGIRSVYVMDADGSNQ